ncbi:UDP-N-acetylenolpyruvoylglucosamine reductase MurB [Thalassoglobus neptunius]|uniref:UDP-N-acetylenolpyruvoylglucosamine reductase n=1 Tax=Thalassoglobus neptunius TaxID=1938619 RepID=A0A5C5WL52_9PLAN|nr:UDP-N-acetylmuramate dehydrogenase [Thalassoglobus neptunius]TWT51514.1 UDP-N-acetylenolpyruvoylglucosamine reductase MurB [Thalassoglobus neptunius]
MTGLDQFSEITKYDEPLAPYTWLKVGGPAQIFIEPRTEAELEGVLRAVSDEGLPVRLLGGGSNVLVRDDGFAGVVIKLSGEEFSEITIEGNRVRVGGAAPLSHVISSVVGDGLAGLENLVGIPGTIGGAIKGNAGGRHGEIGQFVKSVDVITANGERFTRSGDELSFDYRTSSINELVVISAELEMPQEDPDEITKRMRQIWIMKKSSQPFSFQSAGCIFKNPRGLSAGALIEQAGLKGTRVGNAEVSDRHANFIVTHQNATANDVLQLIELIKSRVHEVHGVELATEIQIW